MRKNHRFLIPVLIVLFCASSVFADQGFDESLAKARRLVEEKSYIAALDIYSKIAEGLRKDAGLAIEWARV